MIFDISSSVIELTFFELERLLNFLIWSNEIRLIFSLMMQEITEDTELVNAIYTIY